MQALGGLHASRASWTATKIDDRRNTMDDLQKLKDLAVSETGFVFDPYTGASFSTNATGYTVLQCLKEGLDRTAILEKLKASFEMGEEDVERDVDEFIFLLRENGVLPAEFVL